MSKENKQDRHDESFNDLQVDVQSGEIKPKKKKTLKIVIIVILSFIALLIVGALTLYFCQKNNIDALFCFINNDSATLESMNDTVESEIDKTMEENFPEVKINPITEEQRKAYRNGEISDEEMIEIILGIANPYSEETKAKEDIPNVPGETDSDESTKDETTVIDSETDAGETEPEKPIDEISRLIAEIYKLREYYLWKIDIYITDARSEYYEKDEYNRTLTFELNLADKYLGLGNKLEAKCDGEMKVLLSQLETELKKQNRDTSVVKEINELYTEEKKVKKAVLMDRYYPN